MEKPNQAQSIETDPYEADMEHLLREIRAEFPQFRIVPKRGNGLSCAIDRVLRMVTLGAQHEYMTRYHTVLGNTLYVPDAWSTTPCIDRIITLRHERVHLRQRRRYGDVLLSFLYLIPFFPLGLAYGRARLEWEAYAESVRAMAELKGIDHARSASVKAHVVEQFASGAYGWMWPFRSRVETWYTDLLSTLENASPAGEEPNPEGER